MAMTQENSGKNTVSDSKFHMFRCMIVMAHADNVFCDFERGYMHALMNHHATPLSEEQYQILQDDMENPKQLEDLLPHVTEPEYRGQIVYFARLMAHKDDELHPSEEDLLNRLHANAMDGIDIESLRADAKKAIALDMEARRKEIDELRPKAGIFGAFDRMMLSIGVDLFK